MKYAICDIGSNTIRMNIYQSRPGAVRRIVSEKETAGLGSLRDAAGKLTQEGVEALTEAALRFLPVERGRRPEFPDPSPGAFRLRAFQLPLLPKALRGF